MTLVLIVMAAAIWVHYYITAKRPPVMLDSDHPEE